VDPHLGEFETLVLLALARLEDEAYGAAIHREIAQRTGRAPSFAAVYTTLARLETKHLIASRLGEPTPQRGGRRKKFYAILPAGRRAVRASLRAIQTMTRGLDPSWDVS
jgi:PadR family transcriptional regulator PadR